jgi:hypothetical protein
MAIDYTDYFAPAGYTQLNVGDTGVHGFIVEVFNPAAGYLGGTIRVQGNWKEFYDAGPLTTGIFQFFASDVPTMPNVGDEVTFDIVEGPFSPYAVNVKPV